MMRSVSWVQGMRDEEGYEHGGTNRLTSPHTYVVYVNCQQPGPRSRPRSQAFRSSAIKCQIGTWLWINPYPRLLRAPPGRKIMITPSRSMIYHSSSLSPRLSTIFNVFVDARRRYVRPGQPLRLRPYNISFGSVTAVVDVGTMSQGGNPWRSFIMRFFKYSWIVWRHHGSVHGAIAQSIPHDPLSPSGHANSASLSRAPRYAD
ncbi:hypothetical protein F4815DRAFT_6848 [Daldinia loculata]|nr:hypothetical protein F4815DRAFT_6848 [Daldinia loculata]